MVPPHSWVIHSPHLPSRVILVIPFLRNLDISISISTISIGDSFSVMCNFSKWKLSPSLLASNSLAKKKSFFRLWRDHHRMQSKSHLSMHWIMFPLGIIAASSHMPGSSARVTLTGTGHWHFSLVTYSMDPCYWTKTRIKFKNSKNRVHLVCHHLPVTSDASHCM